MVLISDLSLVRAAHIVLASASPRRSSILNEQFQLNARAVPSTFSEDLDKSCYTPQEYVKETARQKALEVFDRCKAPFWERHNRPPSLVVGADTVVVLEGEILEKPTSTESAREMLRRLSAAGTHDVCTGVTLVYGGSDTPHEHSFVETTKVAFRSLDEAEIDAYVASGEPMDKAGAYGIQGLGGAFVTKIDGDYQNVVGFPAARFCAELDRERLARWVDAAPTEEAPAPPAKDAAGYPVEDPCDPLAVIISDECLDEDECGLPSD